MNKKQSNARVIRDSIDGRMKYARIPIRLRNPQETLSFAPLKDGEDFAHRVELIAQWFDNHFRDKDVIVEISVEEAKYDEQGNPYDPEAKGNVRT